MNKEDTIKHRQSEFMQVHTLTPKERDALIKAKLERARAYSEAIRKREALLVERRWPQSVYRERGPEAHLKHVSNGRPSGWNPSCGTKNTSVLKHIGRVNIRT